MSRRGRPVPKRLRQMRSEARPKWYARFYGNYSTMTGKRKRFSFRVRIASRLQRNRKALASYIRIVCFNLKEKKVPLHVSGQTFHTFKDLLWGTPWHRMRRLREYEAGVQYER